MLFKKSMSYMFLFSCFSSLSCVDIYASEEGIVSEESSTADFSWEKASGRWSCRGASGDYLTGWHYLPTFDNDKKYEWYYFTEKAYLVSPYVSPKLTERLPEVSFDPYALGLQQKENIKTDYEPASIEQGWYYLSNYKGSDTQEMPKSDYLVYIKSEENGNYTLSRFVEGQFRVLSALGSNNNENVLSYVSNDESSGKYWTLFKNEDDSISFVNTYTGLAIGLEGESFTQSLLGITDSQSLQHGEAVAAKPEFYGAKGDGLSDDTEAIRYAVNNNDKVIFSKRYNTTEPIYLDKDNVKLLGDNGVIFTHPEFQTFRLRGKNVVFDSLIFKGDYSIDDSTDNSCIFIKTEKGDGEVYDFNTLITNCKFIETGLRGVHIHSERVSESDFTPASIAANIRVEDCLFETYKIGVCCSGPDKVVVDNCTFNNGYYEHITFDWRARNCEAINNHFLAGERGVGAIGLDASEDCKIKDNEFHYTILYGIKFNNEAGVNKGTEISGNYFSYGGGLGGICFNRKRGYDVSAENITIKDNIFDTAGSDSVLIDSAAGVISFSGNQYKSAPPVIHNNEANIIKDF